MTVTFNPNLVLVDPKTGKLTRDGFILLQSFQAVAGGGTFQPLSAKLTGLSGISDAPGMMAQTAANAFAKRTLQGTTGEIGIANGSGASADPTFSIPSPFVLTSKTITGGTFNAEAVASSGLISADGGQIAFPAVQVPSAGANTLDDYEEGTFTPTIVGTSTAGTGTYTAQVAKYTKIGNAVFFSLVVATSNHTGTGNMVIGGLPFTSDSTSGMFWTVFVRSSSTTLTTHVNAYIAASSTQIVLENNNAGAVTAIALDTTSTFIASGFYHV